MKSPQISPQSSLDPAGDRHLDPVDGYVTACNTMGGITKANHDPNELGESELKHSFTADRAQEDLDRPLMKKASWPTASTNREFIYRPGRSQQRVGGRAAKRIGDWFL